MANTIQVRRGANASLPTLNAGEFGFSTDTHQLYVGDGAANHEISLSAGDDIVDYRIATGEAITIGDYKQLLLAHEYIIEGTGILTINGNGLIAVY